MSDHRNSAGAARRISRPAPGQLHDGQPIASPDFSFVGRNGKVVAIWEHLGLDTEEYRQRWADKLTFYESKGFRRGVNLFITVDDRGGIDASIVHETALRVGELIKKAG